MDKNIVPLITRLGIGIVVLWFSINQFMNPQAWTGLVPEIFNFTEPVNLIYLNIVFEFMIGVFLILGLYTRIVAFLFSLHLIPIIFSLGYGPVAVRDFGLLVVSLSLVFSGGGNFTIDKLRRKK